MKSHVYLVVIAVVLGGAVLSGCGGSSDSSDGGATEAKTATAALPADLFVAEALAGARSVADVKADEGATGEVVIQGRIGGRIKPFVDGAAVFLLADSSMPTCLELHGDSCKTPWDYCCEPADSLAAKTATIQIVDADGKPLRMNVDGKNGLSGLAELTIAGEIAQRTGGALVINARKIHVSRGEE